jgi:hypothetical protein
MTQTNVEGFSLLQHSEECRLSNFSCSTAMLIHNETLVARLASSDVRLPPNYVGVRKVRPGLANSSNKQMMVYPISSDAISRKLQESQTATTTNQPEAPSPTKHHDPIRPASSGVVVFKVVGDDGKERRMTKQEKKEKKRRRALEEKETKKRTKLERRQQLKNHQKLGERYKKERGLPLKRKRQEDIEGSGIFQASLDDMQQSEILESSPNEVMSTNPSTRSSSDHNSSSYNTYHELQVDPNQLEEEWADYHFDRRSIPPVILSPPMAWVAGTVLNSGVEVVRTPQTLLEQKPTVQDIRMLEVVKPNGMEVGPGVRDGTTANSKRISSHNMVWIQYDPEISLKWAQSLKASMAEAESVRDAEDMRPMAYQLVPEPWTRHRGGSQNSPSISSQHQQHRRLASMSCGAFPAGIRPSHDKHHAPKNNEMTDDGLPSSCDWSMVSLRPASSATSFDSDLSIVLEYIHRDTPFFVSCGAKFGCDFLLYDGPRHERHAFAGLRILATSSAASSHLVGKRQVESHKKPYAQHSAAVTERDSDGRNAACTVTDDLNYFPLPTAYSMSGYVRGLNTAGKLALIATVARHVVAGKNGVGAGNTDGERGTSVDDSRQDNHELTQGLSGYRVAIVDLALEKVLSAPTHQRRRNHGAGTVAVRREVGQHLAKKIS